MSARVRSGNAAADQPVAKRRTNGAADGRQPRRRSRATARKAGPAFERSIADYLRDAIATIRGLPNNIDRRVKTGNKDRGDIGGVTTAWAGRVVIECKAEASVKLAGWAAEAATERGNDDALAGVVVHKRHGVADPARQWVTMELAEFVALLTGERPAEIAADGTAGSDALDDAASALRSLYGDASGL